MKNLKITVLYIIAFITSYDAIEPLNGLKHSFVNILENLKEDLKSTNFTPNSTQTSTSLLRLLNKTNVQNNYLYHQMAQLEELIYNISNESNSIPSAIPFELLKALIPRIKKQYSSSVYISDSMAKTQNISMLKVLDFYIEYTNHIINDSNLRINLSSFTTLGILNVLIQEKSTHKHKPDLITEIDESINGLYNTVEYIKAFYTNYIGKHKYENLIKNINIEVFAINDVFKSRRNKILSYMNSNKHFASENSIKNYNYLVELKENDTKEKKANTNSLNLIENDKIMNIGKTKHKTTASTFDTELQEDDENYNIELKSDKHDKNDSSLEVNNIRIEFEDIKDTLNLEPGLLNDKMKVLNKNLEFLNEVILVKLDNALSKGEMVLYEIERRIFVLKLKRAFEELDQTYGQLLMTERGINKMHGFIESSKTDK